MKKRSLIVSTIIIALSIVVLSFTTWKHSPTEETEIPSSFLALDEQVVYTADERAYPDFFYDVDSRYLTTITKEVLSTARTIHDFLPNEHSQSIVSYKSVSVTVIENNTPTDIRETGNSDVLTASQIKLLRSAKYSTNFLIRADYQSRNTLTGQLENKYSTPHITIVPEKQAIYVNGKEALIAYLKENGRESTAIAENGKLQPGKLYFTITKTGTISDVELLTTSGYPSIDNKMIEVITQTPGKWAPAENSKGEKVDQRLVFSFGRIGC